MPQIQADPLKANKKLKSYPTYKLYGLSIRSEIPLGTPIYNDNSLEDLNIYWGENCNFSSTLQEGQILAKFSYKNGKGYIYTQTATGYILRYHDFCEFRMDFECRHIHVHLTPHADPDIIPLLISGNVITFILTLQGHTVLHASAVEIKNTALAFVGNSGMGKSTLAALLCSNGARLITDDTLRLKFYKNTVSCFPGTSEIRLRPNAENVAKLFPETLIGISADKRFIVRVSSSLNEYPTLKTIVIPRLSIKFKNLTVRRLKASEAVIHLNHYPRIPWQARELVRHQLKMIISIVKRVPIYEANIPRGIQHFSQEHLATLLKEIEFI